MNEPFLSIVIPTYNERENIGPLLGKLESALRGRAFEVLVVDDHSPDGTAEAVRTAARENSAVRLISRTAERGLSGAVIRGADESRGACIAVMDADLSHDETLLPSMFAAATQDAELVIGSRRLPGGGADHWPWYRRLASDVATRLAILLLRVPLSDPMSGFFVMRRALYERARPRLNGKGYKILLEIYCKGRPESVRELPFLFKDRRQGHSKLSAKVMSQYLSSLWKLRAETAKP